MKKIFLLLFLSSPLLALAMPGEYLIYSESSGIEVIGGWYTDGVTSQFNSKIMTPVMTGLIQTSSEVPCGFYLGQNSPNPFNPVTNIYFSIPGRQHVKIAVMDVLGKEVSVPVNDEMEPGTYKAVFDASQLSSGVYFYELQTEVFREVKKMTVVK
jgi:hypothetical protein